MKFEEIIERRSALVRDHTHALLRASERGEAKGRPPHAFTFSQMKLNSIVFEGVISVLITHPMMVSNLSG